MVARNSIAGLIMIQHDSSAQGGLATNEFSKRFNSKGSFYR
jgi:hypothetical protein